MIKKLPLAFLEAIKSESGINLSYVKHIENYKSLLHFEDKEQGSKFYFTIIAESNLGKGWYKFEYLPESENSTEKSASVTTLDEILRHFIKWTEIIEGYNRINSALTNYNMETLYNHLTTAMVDKITRRREFDIHRSLRLHWVKHHIEEKKSDNMLCFSVKEPEGVRTYIYDVDEKYVIILEPYRNKTEYYLLTAYHLTGKDAQRDKIIKKYKRKLNEVI